MRRRSLGFLPVIAAAAALFVAAPRAGAQRVVMIDPGMTRDQVIAKLGDPLSSRSYQSFTYLLYKNGCEKKCGMNDLVVLDSNKVVDAVFRSPSRHYSGTSSSPHMISPDAARRGEGAPAPASSPASAPPTPHKKPAP